MKQPLNGRNVRVNPPGKNVFCFFFHFLLGDGINFAGSIGTPMPPKIQVSFWLLVMWSCFQGPVGSDR
jgi:hypothetical protein